MKPLVKLGTGPLATGIVVEFSGQQIDVSLAKCSDVLSYVQ